MIFPLSLNPGPLYKWGAVVMALVLGGCSSMPVYDSPQFEEETMTFQNPNGVRNDKSFGDLMGLAYNYMTRADDPYEKSGFPLITSTRAELATLAEEVLWVGHSTVIVSHGGQTIMTDPVFADRASPFSFAGPKRVTPVPFKLADLPPIDVVVISHSHYDHLDKAAVQELSRRQPELVFVVPLGLKAVLNDWGVSNVRELDWWQNTEVDGMRLTATPVQHWSSRSMSDRNETLWAGWMAEWQDFKFYFAGDTGYSRDFVETRARLGAPDLAAIPIGAYDPRDFMRASHVNPEEAVQILKDVGATKAVPIHWGTYKLTLEPMNEPPQRLRRALEEARLEGQDFIILKHGERVSIQD
ncbi:MAG: MBL fold metallo-hydrolase [Alphaproteobacteria bacterium]|nr:MBL fold metallo-hydrolase [Alphaproteobacteria bacterium]